MNKNNKSDKLETLRVKAALFSYFHFYKRFDIVCNEFSYGSCDILAIQGEAIYEIEVKVSVGDLQKEKSKYKYQWYKQELLVENRTPFRYCYFAVPVRLKEAAFSFIKENFPLSGLLVLNEGEFSTYGRTGIETKIKAPKLIPRFLRHGDYEELKKRALFGMATSLAKAYYDLYEAKKALLPLRLL